jgi:alcohol dehydrogenase class IV
LSADVESARLEWEHAYRDLEEVAREPALEQRVRAQLDAITTELRRRVGGTFTLRELAEQYAVADAWAQAVLAEQAAPGWPRTLTLVEGAAFHLYARGAVDYEP